MNRFENTDAPVEERVSRLVSGLRGRSKRLRLYAGWILAIIVAVLLSGIAVFVQAGALANRDTSEALESQRTNSLKLMMRSRDDIESNILRLQNEEMVARKQFLDELEGKSGAKTPGFGRLAKERREEMDLLRRRSDSYRKELLDYTDQIRQLSQKPITNTLPPEAQLTSAISAIATRVGAVVLLFFLVQILVPLYRYNIRLSSHYESCADTLDLLLIGEMSVPIDLFVRLASSLSPSAVEFGAAPKAPTEQALRLLADIAGRSKDVGIRS
jgi:hypothetical protein